jgi:glycine/D-amino acid oxidase-like deaminating enzyme
MAAPQLAVIGGGIAGMVAALELRQRGFGVTLLERAMSVGGKLRQLGVHGVPVDAGPTVFTLRPLFEQIFEAAGSRLEAHVTLRPLEILARHAWIEGGELDLYADLGRSADAIARFAGARDAESSQRSNTASCIDRNRACPRCWARPGSAVWHGCGNCARSPPCGVRSAITSRIRACGNCLPVTPPIAVHRPSMRLQR